MTAGVRQEKYNSISAISGVCRPAEDDLEGLALQFGVQYVIVVGQEWDGHGKRWCLITMRPHFDAPKEFRVERGPLSLTPIGLKRRVTVLKRILSTRNGESPLN